MILDVNEHCVNKLIFLNNRRKIERDLFAVMKDIAKIEMEYVWKIAIVPSKNYVESVKNIKTIEYRKNSKWNCISMCNSGKI